MIPRIEAALKEIEANRPAGEAKVRFDIYGGGVTESFIRGTRAGLVSAGVRLIRAGLEKEKQSAAGSANISQSLGDLIHEDSHIRFEWIEISDQLAVEPPIVAQSRTALKRENQKIALWVAVTVVLAIATWLALR